LQPADIKSRWRHNWKSAQVVNSHLVCDPTIRQLGFDFPRQQWSLLNCFRTEQGHCAACRRKWRFTDTDLCPCGETQTMSNPVPWQNWMAAYLGFTLRWRRCFVADQLWFMTRIQEDYATASIDRQTEAAAWNNQLWGLGGHKGQHHTMLKIDLVAWWWHHSRPLLAK